MHLLRICILILILARVSHFALAQVEEPLKVKAPPLDEVSPFTMFYDPVENGVILEKQKIDYDLSTETTLRIGPYFFGPDDVSIQMTREQGEVSEIEFGIDVRKRLVPLYVLSFRWPKDFVSHGILEVIDDKNRSVWRRKVTEADLKEWEELTQPRKQTMGPDGKPIKPTVEDLRIKTQKAEVQKRFGLARPETLNKIHRRSAFGLAHTGFFEFPIAQLKEPFRFCLSQDSEVGRLAVCSRRYQITREFGRYGLRQISADVRPRVLVNDKPVTLKGTAIFLDYRVPIKFAAMIKNGSYFEFVSHPKEVNIVDLIEDREYRRLEVIGYGDAPMGPVDQQFYADSANWGILNFMPTIGDLRRFWRVQTPSEAPFIYIRGEGGAPFRQHFVFDRLPSKEARLVLDDKTQRATYSSSTTLKGKASPKVKLSAPDTHLERLSATEFEWEFLAPKKGEMNKSFIEVEEDGHKYRAQFEIYRGRATELSGRLATLVTNDLEFVLMYEVALQHWFEKILFWDHYTLSKLRWGMALRHSDTLAAAVGDDQAFKRIQVTTGDLKYRMTPGIWGRDPSVGLIFSGQNVAYTFKTNAQELTAKAPMVGGGVFWARSMPKILDDFFNIVPFMRYPKWVDAEAIWYPLILEEGKTSVYSFAFNFHGKVQWTPSFFGEAGFGLKNFAWDDETVGPRGTAVRVAIAYGTIGLGYNF